MGLRGWQRLGGYQILGAIGAGGMGEVYRATDTTLDSEVAIKVLPEELARDPERLARFRREAHLLASINHPYVEAVHGLKQDCLVKDRRYREILRRIGAPGY